jgi:hypothetical protein
MIDEGGFFVMSWKSGGETWFVERESFLPVMADGASELHTK